MFKILHILLTSLAATVMVSVAQGATVIDQESSGSIGGGYSGIVVQTFTPDADNLAGVDVWLHGTGALTADVTASIYSDAALTDLLVSQTVEDIDRNNLVALRWDAFEVNTGDLYYLHLTNDCCLTFGAIFPGGYGGGAVIEGGGNLFNGGVDLFFTTYTDTEFPPVPLPAAAWLFGSALLGLGVMKRSKA
jgi:hypothetical protein